MTEEQLAELEIQIAAGTDIPTAFAALPDERQEPKQRPANLAAQVGGLCGGLLFILYWFFGR